MSALVIVISIQKQFARGLFKCNVLVLVMFDCANEKYEIKSQLKAGWNVLQGQEEFDKSSTSGA